MRNVVPAFVAIQGPAEKAVVRFCILVLANKGFEQLQISAISIVLCDHVRGNGFARSIGQKALQHISSVHAAQRIEYVLAVIRAGFAQSVDFLVIGKRNLRFLSGKLAENVFELGLQPDHCRRQRLLEFLVRRSVTERHRHIIGDRRSTLGVARPFRRQRRYNVVDADRRVFAIAAFAPSFKRFA